ncbi:MAG TPA: hypothetical protein VME22_02550 [Solirubrobacteraceae bacterium]|nr:hypothetical protein [Solirubrobacteraceae bacterium]
MQNTNRSPELPARTHANAAASFRRPFAPGAIGFRAMTKVPYNGDPQGGAHVAAYLGAQSVLQRLNAVVPGRWRMEFKLLQASNGAKKRYMACRLIIALPLRPGARDVEAVYEDVGELEVGSPAGLKALYSDARKRAGVAAGIGAYLYTSLAPVLLPIGSEDRQVQVVSRPGGDDLMLSPATEAWLRERYAQKMSTDEVRRDLGEILSHGEPACGIGQGEVADHAPGSPGEAFWAGEQTPDQVKPVAEDGPEESATSPAESSPKTNGVVHVDFSGRGPDAA